MGMDPKQERALRDGSEKPEDQPRDTSRAAVREQEQNPPTAVDARSRDMAAQPGSDQPKRRRSSGRRGAASDDEREPPRSPNGDGSAQRDTGPAVTPGEAQRTLRARREHSKGDGDMPMVEPHRGLIDERPGDRMPHDVPKERDDRSAPKGNVTQGQRSRNPDLETRDDYEPRGRRAASGMDRARADAVERNTPQRRSPARPTARRSSAAKRDAVARTAKGRARPAATRRKATASPGDVTARRTKKAKTSRAKAARAKTKRR